MDYSAVKMVPDYIKMEFEMNKCAQATFKIDKKLAAEGIPLNDDWVI